MSRYTTISNQVVRAVDIDITADTEEGTVDVEFIYSGEVIRTYFTPAEAEQHIKNLQKALAVLKGEK